MRARYSVRLISLVITAGVATSAGLTGSCPGIAMAAATTSGSLTGLGPETATATACAGWKVTHAPVVGLGSVAAVPHSSGAWAAGDGRASDGVLLSWNGTRWKQVRKLSFATWLQSVAAVSPADAWAVGYAIAPETSLTLIEHWNGKVWKEVASPTPGPAPGSSWPSGALLGVAATSGRNAWAVGDGNGETLIEHWSGTRWTQVPSPSPRTASRLNAVTAVSATDAWAVGDTVRKGGLTKTLIEHWNGKIWTQVPSPSPGPGGRGLGAVTATSARNAWAVGSGLIEHWNGRTWSRVQGPRLGSGQKTLFAVAASASGKRVWAVGSHPHKSLTLYHC